MILLDTGMCICLNQKIKRIRSDRGGEYFSNEFNLFCEEHGIIHERTPPYSPESNGVAERKNRTLTEMVNAMLETAGLSWEWWGEAMLTACHTLNKVPMKNKEKTPFEEWENKRLTLSYLRTWVAWQRLMYQLLRSASSDRKQLIVSF